MSCYHKNEIFAYYSDDIITTGCGPHQSNGGIICCYLMGVKEVAVGCFCTYTYTLQMYNNAQLVSVQYYNMCSFKWV